MSAPGYLTIHGQGYSKSPLSAARHQLLHCPAWNLWGTATTVKPGTIILHSKADDVVPFLDSVELVRNSGLPSESLIEVGTEHRLTDEESLKKMMEAVEGAGKGSFTDQTAPHRTR
jgi:hypothetical protein